MSAEIRFLPVWKKGATAEERISEMWAIAREHPERFGKMAIIYEETLLSGNTVVRQISSGCSTTELLGLFVIASERVLRDSEK